MEPSKGFDPKRRPKMVPRCQKCNADRRKVIIVRNGVGHVTDVELDVSGALSQCPSGDPAQQVQSSINTYTIIMLYHCSTGTIIIIVLTFSLSL